MSATNKTSKRIAVAREREEQALELRKAGASYTDIGKRLGITRPAAYRAVVRALQKLNDKMAETGPVVRRLELERLDRLLLIAWRRLSQSNGEDDAALRHILAIMDRRAKYLGLDAPTRIELQETDVDKAIARELARLASAGKNGASEAAPADGTTADEAGRSRPGKRH